jgi:hypothetical protein
MSVENPADVWTRAEQLVASIQREIVSPRYRAVMVEAVALDLAAAANQAEAATGIAPTVPDLKTKGGEHPTILPFRRTPRI